MKRCVSVIIRGQLTTRELPDPDCEVLRGVLWGEPWMLYTPAYWLLQAWIEGLDLHQESRYRATRGFTEELGFCLLGGFGITAELATAAFERCDEAGLFRRRELNVGVWAQALSEPLLLEGRRVRYRYPNQKARFLASAMQYLQDHSLNCESGIALREQLLALKGVGYKTASWVTRNVLGSDDIAILDIHLMRAGRICGLFTESQTVEKDYLEMEYRFLEFSKQLLLRASALDCLIWDHMRAAGSLPLEILNAKEGRRKGLAGTGEHGSADPP
jgi:N-glycosylase/DNA lyase